MGTVLIVFFIAIIVVGIAVAIAKSVGSAPRSSYSAESYSNPSFTPAKNPSFTREYPVRGVNKELAKEHSKKNPDISMSYDDVKDMYERGDRIYEYDISIDGVDIRPGADGKMDLFAGDKKLGYMSKSDSDAYNVLIKEHNVEKAFAEGGMGRCMVVKKNDDYDPDMDEEEDKNWVEWDEAKSPKITLFVKVSKKDSAS